MITRALFEERLGILERRYSTTLEPVVRDVYFRYLSELLDDGLFIKAFELVLIQERFLPTAQDIARKVLRSSEDIANEEWQLILEGSRSESAIDLSDHARKALVAAGGYRALKNLDTVGVFNFWKKYISHYTANAPELSAQRQPLLTLPEALSRKELDSSM